MTTLAVSVAVCSACARTGDADDMERRAALADALMQLDSILPRDSAVARALRDPAPATAAPAAPRAKSGTRIKSIRTDGDTTRVEFVQWLDYDKPIDDIICGSATVREYSFVRVSGGYRATGDRNIMHDAVGCPLASKPGA